MTTSSLTFPPSVASLLALSLFTPACSGDEDSSGSEADPQYENLVSITAEAAGDNCLHGGQRIDLGTDDGTDAEGEPAGEAGDGVLDAGEITSTSFVCNGDNGDDGSDGNNGNDGNDGNDGSGNDGDDGFSSLVRVTEVAADIDADDSVNGCVVGGQLVEIGLDDGTDADGNSAGIANDGVLDDDEVDSASYVCGAPTNGFKISAQLAPGDSISLETPELLTDPLFEAQVVRDGQIYSATEYAKIASPIVENFSFGEAADDIENVIAARLTSGNFVVAWGETTWQPTQSTVANLQLVSSDGQLLGSPISMAVERWDWAKIDERGGLVATSDGGFVLSMGSRADFVRYDSSMQAVDGGQLLSQDVDVHALTTAGDGFALAYGADGDDPSVAQVPGTVMWLDADLTPTGQTLEFESQKIGSSDLDFEELSSGDFALAWLEDDATLGTGAKYAVVDPEGTIVHSARFSNSSANELEITPREDGSWLLVYELGLADAAMYTLIADDGTFAVAPATWTRSEPYEYRGMEFFDGTMLLTQVDYETHLGFMRVLDADGRPVTEDTVFSADESPASQNYALLPLSEFEALAMYGAYDSHARGQAVRITKGYLPLEQTAPAQATLTNYTGDTLEVVLSAR